MAGSQAAAYDVCVIGAGLVGTAAAKYLACRGLRVVLLGLDEASGARGACYDEGRIYRIVDPDIVWARLAEASIGRYPAIQSEADRSFFHECGFLTFGDPATTYMQRTVELVRSGGAGTEGCVFLEGRDALEGRFPWLQLPPVAHEWLGIFQPTHAGHLSPRQMLAAQEHIAGLHGAARLRNEAAAVRHRTGGGFLVQTGEGSTVAAEKVLLAAGAKSFVLPDLLPPGMQQLDAQLITSQAVLFQVDPQTAPADMPVLIYHGREDPAQRFYILPPIRYPNGSIYLKIGYDGEALRRPLTNAAEVDAWFAAGVCDSAVVTTAREHGLSLFKGLALAGPEGHVVCVTDRTCPGEERHRPFIDSPAPGYFVAVGGNGWAAKSADEIGRLAGALVAGEPDWGPDLPREAFRARPRASL
uniref:FAD dependent oxidoreductase domain-containing protein n=1 Tax=Alexandrium monilatum TaxID=311494 RepID=A0A7S4T5Q6_9DINO